jgi:hypothetical protein
VEAQVVPEQQLLFPQLEIQQVALRLLQILQEQPLIMRAVVELGVTIVQHLYLLVDWAGELRLLKKKVEAGTEQVQLHHPGSAET